MSWFRFRASLPKPDQPAITFTSVNNVLSLALMLLEKYGNQDSYDRLNSLIYSYLIYDNYSAEFKNQRVAAGTAKANESQVDSWNALFQIPEINGQYKKALPSIYHGKRIGDTEFLLPIPSLDPNYAGKVRPTSMKGQSVKAYKVQDLSDNDFIEAEYQVRCNLLHGSYDIRNDDIATAVMRAGIPFVPLVAWMVQNTKW